MLVMNAHNPGIQNNSDSNYSNWMRWSTPLIDNTANICRSKDISSGTINFFRRNWRHHHHPNWIDMPPVWSSRFRWIVLLMWWFVGSSMMTGNLGHKAVWLFFNIHDFSILSRGSNLQNYATLRFWESSTFLFAVSSFSSKLSCLLCGILLSCAAWINLF